ncbi:uncharacterized protein LOC131887556 [Tigriopus californicus]|uniref:uncharacterized protein LOC131887556 n=1 Tax=Tigriopus californicus TaxID=6832 RepID=UPI0027DA1882|nr:uncharacterized protein LOC131887556 [Tigriopus californicus]
MTLALLVVLGVLKYSMGAAQIESFRYFTKRGSFTQYPDPFVITNQVNTSGSHIECSGLAQLSGCDAFIFDEQEKSCAITNQSLYTIDFENQGPSTKTVGSKYRELNAISSSLVYVYVDKYYNKDHRLVFFNMNSGTPYEACTYEMDNSLVQDFDDRFHGGSLLLLGNALHFCFPWRQVKSQNNTMGSDLSIGACYIVKPGQHSWTKVVLFPDNTRQGAFTFKLNDTTMWILGGASDSEYYLKNNNIRHGTTTRTTKFYHYDGSSSQTVDGPDLPTKFNLPELSWLNETHVILFGYAEDAADGQKYFISRWPPTEFSWSTHLRPNGVNMPSDRRPSAKLYPLNGKPQLLLMSATRDPWIIDPDTLEWTEAPLYLHQNDCPWPYIHYSKGDVLLVKHETWGHLCLFDGENGTHRNPDKDFPNNFFMPVLSYLVIYFVRDKNCRQGYLHLIFNIYIFD